MHICSVTSDIDRQTFCWILFPLTLLNLKMKRERHQGWYSRVARCYGRASEKIDTDIKGEEEMGPFSLVTSLYFICWTTFDSLSIQLLYSFSIKLELIILERRTLQQKIFVFKMCIFTITYYSVVGSPQHQRKRD